MAKIDTDPNKIDEILSRGVEEAIDGEKIKEALLSGRQLRVKLGIDPTSPSIHLGRAVVLHKLRAFQDLGHKAVFIVGDITGMIGDTSDKDSERPMLTEKEVKKNMESYFKQAYKILDKRKTEVHYNSRWLKKIGFLEIGKMADLFSLHDFNSRELIKRRLDAGKRVSLREVMYPLLQGYDSVAVKSDIELGGTDQRFNLLAGRTIQPAYGQRPQNILMTTLIEGLDGRKMSSSWGNTINLTDTASDMFGKTMSLRDDLILKYFLLCTNVSMSSIKKIENDLGTGALSPRDAKMNLAYEIVKMYHGEKVASESREEFIEIFQKKGAPEDMVQVEVSNTLELADALLGEGIIGSKTEFRRLMSEGAITNIDTGNKIGNIEDFESGAYKIGKKRFVRVVLK